jgi:MOSC domain-containing protein YiiM
MIGRAMTLYAEIQAKLQADPRVTAWFREPWFDGVIDGHGFIARVLEPGELPDEQNIHYLERMRRDGRRAWHVRSWPDVQSALLNEPSQVYLDLS